MDPTDLLAALVLTLIIVAIAFYADHTSAPPPPPPARNRRTPEPYIVRTCYFMVTESPFGYPVALLFNVSVSLPARFAYLVDRGDSILSRDFHSLIQLPGAYIER